MFMEAMVLGLKQQLEAIKKEAYGKESHYIFSLADEIGLAIDRMLEEVRK